MVNRRDRTERAGGLWLILAMLAVCLRILAPSGYMTTPDQPFALVICTGEGALNLAADPAHSDHGAPQSHAPCAFAGVGVATAPPQPLAVPTPVIFAQAIETASLPAALRPGQGLAAPPPPATGPPTLSI